MKKPRFRHSCGKPPIGIQSMSEDVCLRCADTKLTTLPSPEGITFFECPNCHRHYARTPGRTLTDRWQSPISLPLYATIFSANPPDDAPRVAADFVEQRSREELTAILAEIRDELSNPKQSVRHIHNQSQSEESLRIFLKQFVELVSQQTGL